MGDTEPSKGALLRQAASAIMGCVQWCGSPEGSEYWQALYRRLNALADAAELDREAEKITARITTLRADVLHYLRDENYDDALLAVREIVSLRGKQ